MNRRTFIKKAVISTLGVAAGGSLIYSGMGLHDVELNTVRLSIGLDHPLRIAVLGDIHFDPVCEEAYIELVSKYITALQADLIFYTGDFMTHNPSRVDDLTRLLAKATSRLGAFAVFGNHDRWAGGGQVRASLDRQGIRILLNQTVRLPEQENFFLTGLDSFWAGTPDLSIFNRTPVNSKHILLVHEPDPFTQLSDPRIKLQISGHTHGGQVRMPLIGALHLPKWGQQYDAGLFVRDQRLLYVNRGIGTISPHIRFDCRPELTVLELT